MTHASMSVAIGGFFLPRYTGSAIKIQHFSFNIYSTRKEEEKKTQTRRKRRKTRPPLLKNRYLRRYPVNNGGCDRVKEKCTRARARLFIKIYYCRQAPPLFPSPSASEKSRRAAERKYRDVFGERKEERVSERAYIHILPARCGSWPVAERKRIAPCPCHRETTLVYTPSFLPPPLG